MQNGYLHHKESPYMLNGKISKLIRNYSKKKLFYLLLVWFTLITNVGIIVILYVLSASELVLSIIGFLLLLILFFVIIYSKSKISYFDMQHRYFLLLESSKGLEKTNCKFDKQWVVDLQKNNFSMYLDKPSFTIFYKIDKSISKKTFFKTHVLEIVTIVKNKMLDLYADEIESEYKKLWLQHEKEYKLNKQVIIQFAMYKSFSESTKTNLDRIISYKEGDNYLVHINCGYFSDSQSIYYLHSDIYFPNVYYKYAVDSIKSITK